MSATHEQANDDILTLFKAAWDATGLPVLFENIAAELPPITTAHAKVFLRHGPGRQASLSGALGTQRFDREGIVTVQIFIPTGEGLSEGYRLGKIAADAFEGQATPRQVWFRNVRVNEIGPSGGWYQFNALAEFTYDEIK